MRIAVNLATRPYADLGPAIRRLRIGIAALIAICLGLAIGLHLVHNKAEEARTREHALDGQLAQLASERQSYLVLMQQPENAQLLSEATMLNQLIDEKAFSWTLAMENLETLLPSGVQVTTIEPIRDKDGHITLHLRVVGPQDRSLMLVRNLEHSRRFVEPRIVGESAEEAGNAASQRLEPVSLSNRFDFDILADYTPPTLEERRTVKAAAKQLQDKSRAAASPAAGNFAPRATAMGKPNPATVMPRQQGGVR